MCDRGYSPLRITKEAVICPTMPLHQMNSMPFMHTLTKTKTTQSPAWGPPLIRRTRWSLALSLSEANIRFLNGSTPVRPQRSDRYSNIVSGTTANQYFSIFYLPYDRVGGVATSKPAVVLLGCTTNVFGFSKKPCLPWLQTETLSTKGLTRDGYLYSAP